MSYIIVDSQTGKITEYTPTAEQLAEQQQRELDAAWAELRRQRDILLAGCDWTVLSDTPTPTAAWKTYRQELRDLPANTTDPFNPVWPTPPS
jgi:hypothetical protein